MAKYLTQKSKGRLINGEHSANEERLLFASNESDFICDLQKIILKTTGCRCLDELEESYN